MMAKGLAVDEEKYARNYTILCLLTVLLLFLPFAQAGTFGGPSSTSANSFNLSWNVSYPPPPSYAWDSGTVSPKLTENGSPISSGPLSRPSGTYEYQLKKCTWWYHYGYGESCDSATGTVTVTGQPLAPPSVAASAKSCTSTEIYWSAPSSNVSKYYVYEQVGGSGGWNNVYTGSRKTSGSPLVLNGRSPETVYRYRVRTQYSAGGYSAVSGYRYSTSFTTDPCPPGAPEIQAATHLNPLSGTGVDVSWNTASGTVTGYRLQRRNATVDEGWPNDYQYEGSGTGYTDNESKTRGDTYEYRVRAFNSGGDGAWSDSAGVRIQYDRPAVPGNIDFSNIHSVSGRYTIQWSASTGGVIDEYVLEESVEDGIWTTMYSGSGTSIEVTGRPVATEHRYRVRACNVDTCSATTNIVSFMFPGVPATPLVDSITNYGRDYTISWGEAAGIVDRYELEHNIDGDDWLLISSGDELDRIHSVINASTGAGHGYRVRACNITAGASVCGDYSDIVIYNVPGTPGAISGSVDPAVPSLQVSWVTNGPAAYYELRQSTDGGGTWGDLPRVSDVSYSPASAVNGTNYTYRVRACNAQEACSPFTPATTIRLPYTAPDAPEAPTLTVDGSAGTLSLDWNMVSGQVDSYKVEQSTDAGATWNQVQDAIGPTYAPADLPGGTTYHFRVRACNVDACGDFGPEVSGYLPHGSPALPSLTSTGGSIASDLYSAAWAGEYTVIWAEAGGYVESILAEEQEPDGAWQVVTPDAGTDDRRSYNKPPNHTDQARLYRYRARACNSDNCSAWKEMAVQVNAYQMPGLPENFHVSAGPTEAGDYTLRWSRPSGTTEVHYYYLDNADTLQEPDFEAVPHDDGQSYYERTFTGGQSGQTYRYRVRACFQDDNGCDSYTAALDVYIPFPPPGIPDTLGHAGLDSQTGSYTLSWGAASGEVSHYELQRSVDGGQSWGAPVQVSDTSHSFSEQTNGFEFVHRLRACNADACGDYSASYAVRMPYLEPDAPLDLHARAVNAKQQRFTVAWVPATGTVQSYELEQSADGGSTWGAPVEISSPSYTATALTNGATYHYRVRACNVDVCGSVSSVAAIRLPFAAPGAPGPVSHDEAGIDPESQSFIVSWSAASGQVDHYEVQRSTDGGVNWLAAETVPQTSHTFSAQQNGVGYTLRVRACNQDACGGYTPPHQLYLPHKLPTAPGAITIDNVDQVNRSFTTSWTDGGGHITYYELRESDQPGEEGQLISQALSNSYQLTQRRYGKTYYYGVKACNVEGCSPVVQTQQRLPYPTPDVPGQIVVTELDHLEGSFRLTWGGVLGEARHWYELETAPPGTPAASQDWQQINQDAPYTLVHEVTDKQPGEYAYRVRACNDDGCGAETEPAEVVTVFAAAGLPGAVSSNAVASCRIEVEWGPSANGNRYEVQQSLNGGSWQSLAWNIPGTGYVLSYDNAGDSYRFRIRARALVDGQYTPWSGWRQSGELTSPGCSGTSGSNMKITAPSYSETGQYTVTMNVAYIPPYSSVYYQYNGGSSPSTVTYYASNARLSGLHTYSIRMCTDPMYPSDYCQQPDSWESVSRTVTVLRDPGSIGPVTITNQNGQAVTRDPFDQTYNLNSPVFNLGWSSTGVQAAVDYEIQYKLKQDTEWTVLATQGSVGRQLSIPVTGVAYDYRVRACATLNEHVNCGPFAILNGSVRRPIGPPRYPNNTYPADGELVIYDKRVPVQWLPPLNLAGAGDLHHYEVSLREQYTYTDGNGDPVETWTDWSMVASPAPVTDGDGIPVVQYTPVEVEDGGQKQFHIRACGSAEPASCSEALVFDITVIIPPDPPSRPGTLVGQADPDILVERFDGALTGEFSVQPSGAAAYTLPITVPPGTAGVQPALSLNYNSQAGNELAGWGWSLDGTSVIARCNRTLAQDGEIHGVNYTDNDAYCLDGQRLIAIGTDDQGNEAYRTEKNDFRRIRRKTGGACGAWFEVKTQAGETLEYGTTGRACMEAQNVSGQTVIKAWALNRLSDIAGNYMMYDYADDVPDSGFILKRVAYTGHESSGSLPYTSVDFVYEARPDVISNYHAGRLIRQSRRLKRIETDAGYYELGYAPPDSDAPPSASAVHSSRLESVKYCGINAQAGTEQCMEPLTFSWDVGELGWTPLPAAYRPPQPLVEGYKDLGTRLADLDNDGLVDLLYSSPSFTGAFRNTGQGWQAWPNFDPPLHFVDENGEDNGARLADVNADGRPDLLTSTDNGDGTYKVFRNTGAGWSADAPLALPRPFARQKTTLGLTTPDPGTDTGLRVADLNGDGLNDLILSGRGEALVWRNTGNSQNRWQSQGDYTPPRDIVEGDDDEVAGWLVDVTGDGLPEFIYKDTSNSALTGYDEKVEYYVWWNTGERWGSALPRYNTWVHLDTSTGPDAPPTADGPDRGFRMPDFNGDGLPDFIRGNRENDLRKINTGNGWAVSPFERSPKFALIQTDSGIRFFDVNADGRDDTLIPGTAWLSTDDGWAEDPRYALPANPARAHLIDVTGDGRPDLIGNDSQSWTGAWRSRTARPRLVVVRDGLGNTTEVRYKALTDPSLDGRDRSIYTRTGQAVHTPRQQEMNAALSVVDRITVNDGIEGTLTTEYAYKGLTADTGGRGVQHFEQVTAHKPDGTVVTTRYGQRFPYTGLPIEFEIRYGQNGPLLSRTVNEYCYAVTSEQAAGSITNPETAGFASIDPNAECAVYDDQTRAGESVFVYAKKTVAETHQLNNALTASMAATTVVTRNTYGPFGYLTHSLAATTGDGHTYTTETDNTYDNSYPDWHWLGRLETSTVTRKVDGAADVNSTRNTRFEYEDGTGLLAKEIVGPGEGAPEELHTAHRYDQYGNTVQTTVCASNFSGCSADPGVSNPDGEPFRTTVTAYDARGRFPVSVTNALGHTETYAHDHPLGLKTRHTGPNGLTSTWQYDDLGRKKAKTTPVGTTRWTYYKAGSGYTPLAAYVVQTEPPGAAPTRMYYDVKGRERRTLSRNLHGEWVAADTEYDSFGRVVRSSKPYFVYGALVSTDTHWTETDYDVLGRTTRVEVPLGDIDNDGVDDGAAVNTTEYNGFETIVTDAKNRRKLQEQDALGRKVRVVEDIGGPNAVAVEYEYDSQGNLTTTIVDNNPATAVSIEYNKRGHKTAMTDPDMGYWEYRHNGYGDLIMQTDAKGQVSLIQYDALGRITARADNATAEDPYADLSAEPLLSEWAYDTATGRGIGKLHTESGPYGTRKTYVYYDDNGLGGSPEDRGLLTETVYELGPDANSLETFRVRRQYDDVGRVTRTIYPQAGNRSFAVENVYSPFGGLWYVLDAGGNLADSGDDSVYWIAEMVDERGQIMQETLRNKNIINNSYNHATGWLQKVESWDVNLDMIQQTRYGFDAVGNMQYRERFRPWVVEPDGSFHAGQNEQVKESFSYDSLDRLTGATLVRNGMQENVKSFGYDKLGNITHKDSAANTYSHNGCNAGPHAVCQANGSSFVYDANGNMTGSTGAVARDIDYSPFNKPVRIEENGVEVNFTYGAERSRVFKKAIDTEGNTEYTWYVGLGAEGGALYEQKARLDVQGNVIHREHLHFIYAGGYHNGQPFAVHVLEEQENNAPEVDNPVRYDGTEYYHRDHLGSVIAVVGEQGTIRDQSGKVHAQLMSFDPWGKRRGVDWGADPSIDQYSPTSRGNLDYTGHEAVPEVGLIHMNGRIYDPELGVFLSADPHVQFADDSRSYNRYSYVHNNPLRYSDPSGYFLRKMLKSISPKFAQVIGFALNFVHPAAAAVFNAAWAKANGADSFTVAFTATVSFIGGQLGKAASNNGFIQAAVSGSFSGGMHALRNGANFRRGVIQGGAQGVAAALLVVGVVKAANAIMQPSGANTGGASGGIEDYGDRVVGDERDASNFLKVSEDDEGGIVFRALNEQDRIRVDDGIGIVAKNPYGSLSPEDHVLYGSQPAAQANDPWISTSSELWVVKDGFDQGHGVVRIDLSKVPGEKITFRELGDVWAGLDVNQKIIYHRMVWQKEVLIRGYIPQEAITPLYRK